MAVVSQPTIVPVGEVASSLDAAEQDAQLRAFPVPARGQIFIQSPAYPVQGLEVLAMDGRTLLRKANDNELSVTGLLAGPYILKAWTEAGLSVRRIVVVELGG